MVLKAPQHPPPPPYVATFSALTEHFQTAPVAAASSCLLSVLLSRETSGSRPLYRDTSSRVCFSSAHCRDTQGFQWDAPHVTHMFLSAAALTLKMALAQCIVSSSLSLQRFFTRSPIMPSAWMAALYVSCRKTTDHRLLSPTRPSRELLGFPTVKPHRVVITVTHKWQHVDLLLSDCGTSPLKHTPAGFPPRG